MKVYSTLTRKKEDFQPMGDVVKMYVCGITPYGDSHIGHAMSYTLFDVIRRYIEYRGHKVKHVQNFTDVDDKIIARANKIGVPAKTLSERYISEYFEDMDALNIRRAHVYPRVTQEIPAIIKVVQGLVENGAAYVVDSDVYFRVEHNPDYGKLSGRTLDEMRAGARIEVDERKENPLDFALWKASKPHEPAWESPWGKGRPGWHIECTAMSMKYLGDQIDIHGGGQDLVFPHHENEIAQSESYTGKQPFARYWLHNGLLQLAGEKMSKSIGNLVSIKDVLASYDPDTIRLFILSSHYRSPLTYSDEGLTATQRGSKRLLVAVEDYSSEATPEEHADVSRASDAARARFVEAMDDDFNTAAAIAALFNLAADINRARDTGGTKGQLATGQRMLLELADVLGLTLKPAAQKDLAYKPFVDLLVGLRTELRSAKRYDLSDKIRSSLAELGVTLEDTPQGSRWKAER